MIRGEAEARNLPLDYSTGESGGTAGILKQPPVLTPGVER